MISNGLFLFVLAVSFMIYSPRSVAQEAAPQVDVAAEVSDIFYICKRDKLTRWLRAYKLDNGKCHTQYSKEGYLQIISSATYFTSCEGVLHSVQKNLEEGGFKCSPSAKYSVIELD
ncbi:hypothetical protein A11Q_776 [Pseudobdellovibrio exovorus JSS]|uniref:KTSC domain-containing protein n=2 Tax=Pseudobdellovibrio exovorus TaxID=453816 RepID=M4VPE7_9BACT|nr:hypothetical protein A11Q_776 [Pseudobdellovibrio exovorus JSS]